MTRPFAALLTSCLLLSAQPAEPPAHQKLMPTLWVQTSAEWRAACLQTYRAAHRMLDRALRDKAWTAATEQLPDRASSNPRKLPPAVILDVDETVLDNSPAQARQVLAGADFEPGAWNSWVSESRAAPVPGAVEFCRFAASRGVTVFYVSNREASQEAATRANLARHGFPLSEKLDTVLCRGEKPEWSSDKGSRRAEVASRFRVLLLIGDDLGDFLSGVRTSVARRQTLSEPYSEFWGWKWFLLPNPGYGSWEEAVYGEPRPAEGRDRLRRKIEALIR